MANRNGKKYGLTALFPIKPGEHSAQLRSYLRSLDDPSVYPCGSPLCNVPIVHMARFVIIDRLAYQGFPARADYLNRAYLLFMCDFDGADCAALVDAILDHMPEAAAAIWEHCIDFPIGQRRELIRGYFEKCQLETNLFLADRPNDTVTDILAALMLKREFGEFLIQVQRAPRNAKLLHSEFWQMWRQLESRAPPMPGSL